MNDFWSNISRYPRFFISSMVGVIFVVLTPLKNLFKIKNFRLSLILASLSFLILLCLIIREMTVS